MAGIIFLPMSKDFDFWVLFFGALGHWKSGVIVAGGSWVPMVAKPLLRLSVVLLLHRLLRGV